MTDTSLQSSDSDRHARPLKYAFNLLMDEPLDLEQGGRLTQVNVTYETYGGLNAERSNAVLLCHALSGDSHVAAHSDDDDEGWWDIAVGPGKPIDTDRYFVICPNILGGCRGTTGPNSFNPDTGRPYGADFPVITIRDIVEVQRRLIDHLGIDRLLAVIGGSLGGHMALTWASRHSDRLLGVAPIATSACLTSQALAFDIVGRNAILRDPDYQEGQYYESGRGPLVGLAIARMLGHITYLSREGMTEKFDAERFQPREVLSAFETKFSVGSYLAHQGDRFGERFDANSYITLSMAMDLFDLGITPEKLAGAIGHTDCRWLLMSFTSDWLFPPFQSQQIVDALIAADKPVSYCNIESNCGHDAFLLPDNLPTYGEMIRAFLANLSGSEQPSPSENAEPAFDLEGTVHSPTSIFHGRHRLDYDTIVELIPPGASVLDLGCGTGSLLARLAGRGHKRVMGIEWDEQSIVRGLQRGLDVVQADLNQGLAAFAEDQFDIVVLSQTLQTVMDVQRVVDEMLRVGSRGIVSFPNLAHRDHRFRLSTEGRAPGIDASEGRTWYNTPNVRFLSLYDFEDFCRDKGITIHEIVALDTAANCRVEKYPNFAANVAIAVVSK
jgi:homoserine O-acetyltransferase